VEGLHSELEVLVGVPEVDVKRSRLGAVHGGWLVVGDGRCLFLELEDAGHLQRGIRPEVEERAELGIDVIEDRGIVGDDLPAPCNGDNTMGSVGNGELIFAVDESTGKKLWATKNGKLYRNSRGDGPRGTPTIACMLYIVDEPYVFVSSAYGTGGALLFNARCGIVTQARSWSVNIYTVSRTASLPLYASPAENSRGRAAAWARAHSSMPTATS
jgi:hypothetical protein